MIRSFLSELKSLFDIRGDNLVTIDKKKKAYEVQPSIAQELPWMEYDKESKSFLLQDGMSVAALFEIQDVACEATPEEYLLELSERFQGLFQNTIPQETENPWHLQFFLQDEINLKKHVEHIEGSIKPIAKNNQFTSSFLKMYSEHCDIISRSDGLFRDNAVTGNVFQGNKRHIRLVLYRFVDQDTKYRRGQEPISHLNMVANRLKNQLKSADVKIKRCDGKDFYEWMTRWFNPGQSGVLENQPYPGDDQLPFGYDFVEQLFKSAPESSHEDGVWYFNGQPHALLSVQSISVIPKIGHITAERRQGKQRYGLFDRFPESSIFVMNIVIEHQSDAAHNIKKVHKSCAGNNIESVAAREQCEEGLREIEFGNYLFPVAMGVYVKGRDLNELHASINEVETLLSNNGFMIVDPEVELAPCDAYLRFLPMSFNYLFDKAKGIQRSRYIYARQIANLLPLYGRYRGSDNPCILRWNRGGEPLTFDPFSKKDKSANSHMLYLAETGGGKSASLVFDLMSTMAIYNPRIFILEAGDSFGLFCRYAEKHGKSVNQVTLSASHPTPLNPFADALKILDSKGKATTHFGEKVNDLVENLSESFNDNNELDADEERDILGEMALSAELMITGGDKDEVKKFTRANRTVVLEALVEAAQTVFEKGGDEVIAEDVIAALKRIAKSSEKNNPEKVTRIFEMADSMSHFTKDKFTSSFFNRKGKPWPEVDITRLDMGLMKNEQYEAQLSLAVMGMLNCITHIAETTQYDERMTIVLIDESHILTKNPLTAASITQFSKMCRKLGMWLWLATQNMADFPDESRKMLSMIEFWIGLGTSESEIDEIRRFKQITAKEKELFLSVHKDIPNYVEGVIMSRKINGLFRNVPPRLALALGMTEKEEKARRRELMAKHNVDELTAVEMMADQMKKKLLNNEVSAV